MYCRCCGSPCPQELTDTGPNPDVIAIRQAALRNTNFRTAIWTGEHLQAVLMSIPMGGEIGLEVHEDTDQFLRVEQGVGIVKMGAAQDSLTFMARVTAGDAIFVPAGTWHNLLNAGNYPLKLTTIYAPPEHPRGTVQATRAEALAAEAAEKVAEAAEKTADTTEAN